MSNIYESIKSEFPNVSGNIEIKEVNHTVFVKGDVSISNINEFKSKLNEYILNEYPGRMILDSVKYNSFNLFRDSGIVNDVNNTNHLDEVGVLYYGYLSVDQIKQNLKYKTIHLNNQQKIDNTVKVLNFISPIVLNSDLEVIDGNIRIELAKENDIKEVPVIVIDDNGIKADLLRLALNRSSEFQRWNYVEVDDYVDNNPVTQPILEPLGFFGKNVLPVSFFSDTVVQYIIDPFNKKQSQYNQEEGLAEWAKIRRKEMEELSKQKRAKRVKKVKNVNSLFDKIPTENDFLETYNPEEEMKLVQDKWQKIGEEITKKWDDIRRPIIEAAGKPWQLSAKSTKQLAIERREKFISKITNSNLFNDLEKEFIIEDIDNYSEYFNNLKGLREVLNNGETNE